MRLQIFLPRTDDWCARRAVDDDDSFHIVNYLKHRVRDESTGWNNKHSIAYSIIWPNGRTSARSDVETVYSVWKKPVH